MLRRVVLALVCLVNHFDPKPIDWSASCAQNKTRPNVCGHVSSLD